MSPQRAACYIAASFLLGITQGLGLSLLSSNLTQLQGDFGATQQEALWLAAAYMAPSASVTLALIKIRNQFGLRRFGEVALIGFVVSALLNVWITDLHSGIAVRFMSGLAAAPISTLAFLYMLEPFPPARKLSVGLSLALTGISIGTPLSRVLSPSLMDTDSWFHSTLLELGLALLCLAVVFTLPLAPVPRQKVIERWDFISYPLIAVGLGGLAVVLVMGKSYWWFDAEWLGILTLVSAISIGAAIVIELHRTRPLLDVRWLFSPAILQFAGALIVFRIVLSEQASGAPGLYLALGLQNQQMQGLFWVILLCTIAGGLVSAVILKPGREHAIHIVALMLIIIGALIDAQSTSQTRPEQMLFSQGLIAFASAIFLPAALAAGLMVALKRGPQYILSFVIVFLTTQRLGGIAGTAVFQTVMQFRLDVHTNLISAHLMQGGQLVAERLQTYAASLAQTLPDAAARQAQATSLLSQAVQKEATVLAYNDVFTLIALVAACAMIILIAHWGVIWLRSRHASEPANG